MSLLSKADHCADRSLARVLEHLDLNTRHRLHAMLYLLCTGGSTPLTVNTACSGTDAAITTLQKLADEFPGFTINHLSSTEYSEPKQEFIRVMFPDLRALFTRLEHTSQLRALNVRDASCPCVIEATSILAALVG